MFYKYKEIINHKKYSNNYDYNKAIFLMGGHNLTENGFLLMKEDSSIQSPVACYIMSSMKILKMLKIT